MGASERDVPSTYARVKVPAFTTSQPATYTLRFMLGVDWNDNERVFRREVEAHAFDEAVQFNETRTAVGVTYSKQSVTLHKVINGNAPSTILSPDGQIRRLGDGSSPVPVDCL